jgi:hypothetical protein
MCWRSAWYGFALAALLTGAGCVDLWRHTGEFAPGALRTELPGGCSLMHYTLQSEQPFRTMPKAAAVPSRRRAHPQRQVTRPGASLYPYMLAVLGSEWSVHGGLRDASWQLHRSRLSCLEP